MSGVAGVPECPQCGAMMVARRNRKDGSAFWGCSQYPRCHGTRNVAGGMPPASQPVTAPTSSRSAQERGFHLDRFVLACGAVGLAVGFGFIAAAAGTGPKLWALVGASFIFLSAVSVLSSPMSRPGYARSIAFKIACAIVMTAAFVVFAEPLSKAIGQYTADYMMQSIHTPAVPSAR